MKIALISFLVAKVECYVFIYLDEGLSIDLEHWKLESCTQMDHHPSSIPPLPQLYNFLISPTQLNLKNFNQK